MSEQRNSIEIPYYNNLTFGKTGCYWKGHFKGSRMAQISVPQNILVRSYGCEKKSDQYSSEVRPKTEQDDFSANGQCQLLCS